MERVLCSRSWDDFPVTLRSDMATYQESRDLVEIGAYKAGSNPRLDRALERRELVELFLKQGRDERTGYGDTQALMAALLGEMPMGNGSRA